MCFSNATIYLFSVLNPKPNIIILACCTYTYIELRGRGDIYTFTYTGLRGGDIYKFLHTQSWGGGYIYFYIHRVEGGYIYLFLHT